ncbi:ribonuclease H family protein [Clostridium sp. M14]|uniref:ribonuclease H family protein n=1 Tax=Clostridium sp. M14 TaxID=2716311 RepID=UPI0013EE5A81|nr:ribonuclease H family protein [Clostridium sp. M14]MBZ9693306.1 ribonuclease H family protein [Clostridium sp. M14]
MKYYAIRQINGETINKILTNWDACKKLVTGNRAEYKSFKAEQEAKDYLGDYIEEESEEDVLNNKENYVYYVDGSYMNDTIGWGFILVKHNEELTKMCGEIKPTENNSRNISGELESAKMAVRHAISNGLKEIYIVNDYQGISSYITGAWKPKTSESKDYTNWMLDKINRFELNIKFIKVKGHTSNKWNDEVDTVAKLGTQLL